MGSKSSQSSKSKSSGKEEKDPDIDLTFDEYFIHIPKENEYNRRIKQSHVHKVGGSFKTDIRLVYKFTDFLGEGKFGVVHKAHRRLIAQDQSFAIKSIRRQEIDDETLHYLTDEVKIMTALDNPNCVKFYETYYDDVYFHIVMECLEGKPLYDIIEDRKQLDEPLSQKIVLKILSGLSYLHSVKICHRDLKPQNVMVDLKNPEKIEVKLIDFGLAKKQGKKYKKMRSFVGTPYFIAPEVIDGFYDEKCDIWSVGALTYLMLSGCLPFHGSTEEEIYDNIREANLVFHVGKWDEISEQAIDFIKLCLTKDPEKRIDVKGAVSHKWLALANEELHKIDYKKKQSLESLKEVYSNSLHVAKEKLKRLILNFMLELVPQEEISKIKNSFIVFDLNNDGFISIKDLKKIYQEAGIEITDEELKMIQINIGNDDQIDYSSFLIASINKKLLINKEKLTLAFSYFDVDKSGYIDSRDLRKALLREGHDFTQEEIDSMVLEVKLNKGSISLKDFLGLFNINENGLV